jgi:hypothetical protein
MRRTALALALTGMLAAATALDAQQAPPAPPPGGGGGPGGPIGNTAAFLLANTGALKLTDAQVVRLAAIARRTNDRERALRATMDSARGARERAPRDSGARNQRRSADFSALQPALERMREQTRIDRRDAIAVLTPDQQAEAWELVAMRGAGPAFARRGMANGFGPRRDGPGTRRDRDGRDDRDDRGGPRREGPDGPPDRRPPN